MGNLSPDLARRLTTLAQQSGVSVDTLVERAVDQYMGDDIQPQHDLELDRLVRQHIRAALPFGVFVMSAHSSNYPIIFSNYGFERLTGYPANAVVDQSYQILVGDDLDQEGLTQIQQALADNLRCTVVLRCYGANGALFFGELMFQPILNGAGVATHYIGMLQDVTRRVQTEDALAQNEGTFRTLFYNNPQAMCVYNRETLAFLDVNNAALKQYGYEYGEFLSLTLRDIRPPEDIPIFEAHIARRREAYRHSGVWRHQRKDASILYVQITSHTLNFNGQPAVLMVAHDVTDQLELQQAVIESEMRYRAVSEMSYDYAFSLYINEDGTTENEWITDAFEQVTGYTSAEMDIFGWAKLVHPDDMPIVEQALAELLINGRADPVEHRLITKTGEVLDMRANHRGERDPETGRVIRIYGISRDITERKRYERDLHAAQERFYTIVNSLDDVVYTLDMDERHTGVWGKWLERNGWDTQTMLGLLQHETMGQEAATIHHYNNQLAFQGQTVLFEWSLQADDGSRVYFQNTVAPLRNADGDIIGLIGVGRDVTAIKELHSQRMENQRVRIEVAKERELIDLKERFVSMVSHEFRNPLSVMVTSASMIERYANRMTIDDILRHSRQIVEEARSMNNMIEDILVLSRANAQGKSIEREPLDIAAVIKTIVDTVQTIDNDQHPLLIQMDLKERTIYANQKLLEHMLVNLLTNACKYSDPGQPIKLVCYREMDDVVFEVRDNGIGIPPEDHARILDAFHRARNVGNVNGTGLGLAIVKQSVEAHNGSISFTSRLDEGTTFHIRLPMSANGLHSRNAVHRAQPTATSRS